MRIIFVFVMCVYASSQLEADDLDNNLHLKAMAALGYADLFRASLMGLCSSPIYSTYPICVNLYKPKNETIEMAALPYFSKYVPANDSEDIIKFYLSEPGKNIGRKIINDIFSNTHSKFSDNELKLLDTFNNSKAGQSLHKLATDRQASVDIIARLNK